jgi:hypothetical protein
MHAGSKGCFVVPTLNCVNGFMGIHHGVIRGIQRISCLAGGLPERSGIVGANERSPEAREFVRSPEDSDKMKARAAKKGAAS